ncbi:MAG: NADH-quinone oxidoreductase subunit A [Deltaproteobacteria bacterium]|nr:NADH-quinone oxidoreductase subunit A [Deltaproteobacteria bacterium]
MNVKDLIDYMYIGLFFLCGIAAAGAPILISHLVRPRTKISKATLQTYECGNIPFGQSWDFRHGIGFYSYALIFLAFEVDVLYLYPVATVFHKVPALRGIGVFFLFLGILALGLVYAWRKGVFLWTSEKKIY